VQWSRFFKTFHYQELRCSSKRFLNINPPGICAHCLNFLQESYKERFYFFLKICTLRKDRCNFNGTHFYFRQGVARAYRHESKSSGKRIHALIVDTTEKDKTHHKRKNSSHCFSKFGGMCLLPQPFSRWIPSLKSVVRSYAWLRCFSALLNDGWFKFINVSCPHVNINSLLQRFFALVYKNNRYIPLYIWFLTKTFVNTR